MKKNILIIIAFLGGITLFSLFKYIKISYEKKEILNKLQQAKSQILSLNALKEQLSQQLNEKINIILEKEKREQELLKEMKIKEEKLITVEEELNKAQKEIESLNRNVDNLQKENLSLKEEKKSLSEEINRLNAERDSLLSRFNSLTELKKAITQLKRKIYLEKIQTRKSSDNNLEGNRGYIIKNGLSTLRGRIKIEIFPAQ